MVINYIKIALRNIRRNFTYSVINISGLAIGLASCLLIVAYVQHELSYDTFHNNSERIYRVGYEVSLGSGSKEIASSPYRLAGALEKDFPQLEKVTHFSRLFTSQVTFGEKIFRESQIAFADSNFFDVFNFEMVRGAEKSALSHPYQVVITDKMARKYFGGENALGKTLKISTPYSDEEIDLAVSGIMREMPSNSHFHMNFLVSMPTGQTVFSDNLRNNWGWDSHYTYVKMPEPYQADQFRSALIPFGEKNIQGNWFLEFFAQPMEDIHLYSNLNSEIEANGNITFIYIFSAIALIILIIACINYMNLATARATNRAREVGVRKAIGAHRGQLVMQFLGESVLTVFFSMLLAVGLAELATPVFNELSGKSIELGLLFNQEMFWGSFLLMLMLGVLSGLYPAFFLSSFEPVKVLKESMAKIDRGALFLRKGLVTFQFTISIILIAGTIVVFNQLDYLRSKDIGANTDQVIMVPVQTASIANNFETIREELLRYSEIKEVTTSNRRFGRNINSGSFYEIINDRGVKVSSRLSNVWVGWDFFDFYDIELMAGRSFSRSLPSDTTNNAVIISSEAARVLEISPEDAIGESINAGEHFRGTVIGVAENFHFEALYNQIKPMIFILDPSPPYINFVSVKVATQDLTAARENIKTIWNQFEPDRIFISSLLNNDLYRLYQAEERFMKVFGIFTLLAIFTACLGIFGLAKFTAGQRTKEIGIRKVLGATAADIVKLLSKEVVLLAGLAFLLAAPIAYVVMNQWLQQFAYKTSTSAWIFIVAGLIAAVIALVTVSWQTVRAAMINPIISLRNE